MKIQTFSVVVGGNKCNAFCPYCVSKMTGSCTEFRDDINERNFHKSLQFARQSGVSTILLTGKGEPLLYPSQISRYLELISEYDFPFVELQTNGIDLSILSRETLKEWYNLGLTTVSLSCVHWDDDKNREIFGKEYKSLKEYVDILYSNKFFIRVNCVMLNDYIKDIARVEEFTNICKRWGVHQFTVRPVVNNIDIDNIKDEKYAIDASRKLKTYNWIKNHFIETKKLDEIRRYFEDNGTLLLELAHGARVYDYKGQNISINTCLTRTPDPEYIRQLIFFSNGSLYFDWEKMGARLL